MSETLRERLVELLELDEMSDVECDDVIVQHFVVRESVITDIAQVVGLGVGAAMTEATDRVRELVALTSAPGVADRLRFGAKCEAALVAVARAAEVAPLWDDADSDRYAAGVVERLRRSGEHGLLQRRGALLAAVAEGTGVPVLTMDSPVEELAARVRAALTIGRGPDADPYLVETIARAREVVGGVRADRLMFSDDVGAALTTEGDPGVRRMADIEHEALHDIAMTVFGPNPDAVGVDPSRLVDPYPGETVARVREMVALAREADLAHERLAARITIPGHDEPGDPALLALVDSVLALMDQAQDARRLLADGVLWHPDAVDDLSRVSLLAWAQEYRREVDAWHEATRMHMQMVSWTAIPEGLKSGQASAADLRPAQTVQFVCERLDSWCKAAAEMVGAVSVGGDVGDAVSTRSPRATADRVIDCIADLRRGRDEARAVCTTLAQAGGLVDVEPRNDSRYATELIVGIRAHGARPDRYGGVLALLAAAADLDPTQGGTSGVRPSSAVGPEATLWDERVRLTGWLLERAHSAATSAGEQG